MLPNWWLKNGNVASRTATYEGIEAETEIHLWQEMERDNNIIAGGLIQNINFRPRRWKMVYATACDAQCEMEGKHRFDVDSSQVPQQNTMWFGCLTNRYLQTYWKLRYRWDTSWWTRSYITKGRKWKKYHVFAQTFILIPKTMPRVPHITNSLSQLWWQR